MNAYYKGQLLCGPRGPAGPDGNPVGTVISFLGLTAPKDYLICDGAEYPIVDYPELSEFFQQQFGAANHFGGDGAVSFAVPDMRNLFLRGYHGESEEPLSGDIGEKQEATKIPNIYIAANGSGLFVGKNPSLEGNWPDQVDRKEPEQSTYSQTSATVHSGTVSAHYTTRPINMAVLFCIKAAESVGGGLEEYDTEDGWHVRKWSDGYVEMRIRFDTKTTYATDMNSFLTRHDIDQIPELPLELNTTYTDVYSLNSLTAVGWLGSDRGVLRIITGIAKNKIDVSLTREVSGRWK